ncbi:alpha/beta fold hydrolase [Pseudobutyrivibrio ruminis]|uniref:Pimeloyl-ACP methyl ester carboxylesterase n=1 Tax=Pseudobutyrivibrio ruminis DSM 9787 TaxID=1123011 RepID=A0A285RSQ7_9FIRM|nr:alpha/beta hydrolase [Pseudobutyrivibrio ruminis]SOB96732.1 Pimeloyl-ACP methyl ester carboxylesterase [Pseudobutyrivibrio ruminis DSM 9787]
MQKNGCVKVGNTDMYYVAFGEGEKNLVVLPGLSDGLWTVKGKAMLLAGSYKKFFKDYTVYMFSRKNEIPEGYSIEDMADDQALAMRNLGIDRAIVMGVSQGGMIAQFLAANHSELVEKLILVVTAPYANETIKGVVTKWIEMTRNASHTELMLDTAEKVYTKEFNEKNKRYLPLVAKFTKPKTYDRFCKNAYAILAFDSRPVLSKIKCPTYIMSGNCDNTVGNDAPYELHAAIEHSEILIFEGLGHGLFEEDKNFYNKVFEICGR